MTGHAASSRLLHGLSWLVAGAYALLLLPVLLFGAAAYLDSRELACPGANQCGDADLVMKIALMYVLAAPLVWLAVTALQKAAGTWGGKADA